jgi:hypothetical protein
MFFAATPRADNINDAMLAAFKPFTQYITYLAEGKLDKYFDSIQPEELVTDLEVELPTQPMLLLHGLGENTDREAIKSLFASETVFVVFLASFSWRMINPDFAWYSHLFAVSGAGKTRRTLEGLCHYWGFYISCRPHQIGSSDFEWVTKIMTKMSKWDGDKNNIKNNTKNVDVSSRAFAMLICARVFVLKHLLEQLPSNTDDMVARRRWVLAQVMPPFTPFARDDMFTTIIISLRGAEETDMLHLASAMLQGMTRMKGRLFAVVDEAQVAAEYLSNYFRSFTTGIDMRPVLHAFHKFLWKTRIFRGVILAGTGLSMETVKKALSSQAAKSTGESKYPTVSVELGRFTKDGTSHVDYIRKYLSLRSISDRRLEDRILYWFSGR